MKCVELTLICPRARILGIPEGKFIAVECPLGLKTGKARYEHMFSALPLKADSRRTSPEVRFRANNGSRAHSITSSQTVELAAMVILAARLAAILLPFARGL